MRRALAMVVFFLLFLGQTKAEFKDKALVVVANDIDYENAYRQYFDEKGILAFYASPKKFPMFRQYPNMLIMGGPDSPQTGELVSQVLSPSEMDFLRIKGNRGLFEKRNVWAQNQRVFVAAGWDRNATKESVWENLKRISSSLLDTNFWSSGEIPWMRDDLESGFTRAVVEDRLVLVYFWASWCQWCARMEADVFADARVREVISKYYVPVRLDYDKGRNAELAHSHYIWGTPAFLAFDKEGRKIGFMDGYKNVDQFLGRLLKYVFPQKGF